MKYCYSFIQNIIVMYSILILPMLFLENRTTRVCHPMANGLVEAQNKILKRLVLLVNYITTTFIIHDLGFYTNL